MPRRREKEPTLGTDMPKTVKSGDLTKADLTMMWAPFCAKRKLNPAAYTKELATFLNVRSSTPSLPSSSLACDAVGRQPHLGGAAAGAVPKSRRPLGAGGQRAGRRACLLAPCLLQRIRTLAAGVGCGCIGY